jgi:lysophospholipase L1-like esterase
MDVTISRKKQWFFRILLLAMPIVLWIAIELLLSLILKSEKPFRRIESKGSATYLINQSYFDQFFLYQLPEMNNLAVSNNWMPVRKENTLRIFCLGGSTTLGYPYNNFLDYGCPISFPRFLESILNDQKPSKKVEVLNLGCNALSSREIKHVLRDAMDFSADIFVIYTGHNEFFGPNEFAISKSKQFLLTHRWVADVFDLLRQTWLYRGMRKLLKNLFGLGKRQENDFKGWSENNFVPFDSGLEKRLQNNYRKNLVTMIKSAQKSRVPVFLCTVVSNWLFPPFMSVHNQKLTENELAQWNIQFQEGKRLLQEKDWGKALQFFTAAEIIDSLYADLYFQKRKAFRKLGDTDGAISSIKRAIELDALPFRARSWINPIIRSVGKELNIPVIDLEKQFIDLSKQGIPDPDLLLEHLHPNVNGYYEMAKFIAESIMNEPFWSSSESLSIHPLEFYLENYNINQLSIDKVEYDLCLRGNYLERLSLFNPEVRQFIFNVCTRAYEDAVRIRDEYLKSQGEQW